MATKTKKWTPKPGPKSTSDETAVSYVGKGPRGKKGLVEMYADKLSVRQARGSVEQTQRIKAQMSRDGTLGRQTSPEIAALASRYMRMTDDEFYQLVRDGQGVSRNSMLAESKQLAASALGQVNE